LIIHHPNGIQPDGEIREQFHHVSDIAPTILEMLNVQPKARYEGYDQLPISGTSFAYSFDSNEIISRKPVQYFEMNGHRGLWHDGWKAVTRHQPNTSYDDDEWELYNLSEDFSETNNLALDEPEKLRELIEMWWVEAGRYGVLPLADASINAGGVSGHPGAFHENLHYRFANPMSHIPSSLAPQVGKGDWSLLADIQLIDRQTEGVVYSQGNVIDGFSLYVQDERLCFAHNAVGKSTIGSASLPQTEGRMTIGVTFAYNPTGRGGIATLVCDGDSIGAVTVPMNRNAQKNGVDIGKDVLSPITNLYQAPFAFTGLIYSVEVDITQRK
jgi:arylsulfatase